MSIEKKKYNSKKSLDSKTIILKILSIICRFLLKNLIVSVIATPFIYYLIYCYNTTIPEPTSYFYVNDYSKVLSNPVEEVIIRQGEQLCKKTKAQIVVVTIPDTFDQSLEGFSNDLANKWGIGDKELDNGVLILFTTKENHVRLEIGNGLEGCLPDAKCGRILDDYTVESKNSGNWNEAALNTWNAVAKEIYNEYNLDTPEELLDRQTLDSAFGENTMADSEIINMNKDDSDDDSFLTKLFVSFCVSFIICGFLLIFIIPIIFLCKLGGNTGSSGSYSSGGSYGGGSSGGGGGFSGGGASR